jgi:hypothetical protein
MGHFDQLTTAEHERVFDRVLKFADIAGKVVLHQAGQHWIGDPGDVSGLQPVEACDELLDQERNVFPAVPETPQIQADNMNAPAL